MKIITSSLDAVAEAVAIMKAGGVVVMPTETAYGLACDFFQKVAYQKIYAIKGRDWSKLLSAITFSIEKLDGIVEWSNYSLALAKKYWPGPLTLILPLTKKAKTKLSYHQANTLAVRQSSHPVAAALAEHFSLISATSANLSGSGELYQIAGIKQQFNQTQIQPNIIIDVGNLPVVAPSTIVDCTGTKPVVVRQGSVVL
ncbi:MAG: L-threonylcarbamoyladenylate synthase [Candidatus Komeilibacteria bacterium]|nr:L-threonylcarbamoyladenylate synthase [Candidatus Komeilibacteria bacterium]